MAALLVGYARCSTEQQDLTAQRDGLLGLGVDPTRRTVQVQNLAEAGMQVRQHHRPPVDDEPDVQTTASSRTACTVSRS